MKNLLILADAVYPDATAGSHRLNSFAKFLPDFGWNVTVVGPEYTAQNCDWFDGKLTNRRAGVFQGFPYSRFSIRIRGWKRLNNNFMRLLYGTTEYSPKRYKGFFYTVQSLLMSQSYNVLLSSYPQLAPTLAASALSKQFNIPWIVDFRDIPCEFDCKNDGDTKESKKLYSILNNALSCCNFIITVSEPLKKTLKSKLLSLADDIGVVYNGFDGSFMKDKCDVKKSERFRIVFAGTITSAMLPDMAVKGLHEFLEQMPKDDRKNVSIEFYGSRRYTKYFKTFKFSANVIVKERVPQEDIYRVYQETSVLLLLSSPNNAGIMSSKIFELLKLKLPILMIPDDKGVMRKVLDEVAEYPQINSVSEISTHLNKLYANWKSEGKHGTIKVNEKALDIYSRRNQAKVLAAYLDALD